MALKSMIINTRLLSPLSCGSSFCPSYVSSTHRSSRSRPTSFVVSAVLPLVAWRLFTYCVLPVFFLPVGFAEPSPSHSFFFLFIVSKLPLFSVCVSSSSFYLTVVARMDVSLSVYRLTMDSGLGRIHRIGLDAGTDITLIYLLLCLACTFPCAIDASRGSRSLSCPIENPSKCLL